MLGKLNISFQFHFFFHAQFHTLDDKRSFIDLINTAHHNKVILNKKDLLLNRFISRLQTV
jgi:hypothetical protein